MRSNLNAMDHFENVYAVTDQYLGYTFSPPCHHDHPCHRQLDIAIHAMPTLHHYDPESARFPVFSDFWGFETIKVSHPWRRIKNYRVLPGFVIMKDRVDKTVEAFTFGGDLRIETKNDCTMCSLKSSAPIIPLDMRSSVSTLLADEVQIILAKRREAWDEENPRTAFEEHLAEVDPSTLYMSCLDALQDKFSHFPHPDPENILKFRHFLRTEIRALHENSLWPMYLPSIERLL